MLHFKVMAWVHSLLRRPPAISPNIPSPLHFFPFLSFLSNYRLLDLFFLLEAPQTVSTGLSGIRIKLRDGVSKPPYSTPQLWVCRLHRALQYIFVTDCFSSTPPLQMNALEAVAADWSAKGEIYSIWHSFWAWVSANAALIYWPTSNDTKVSSAVSGTHSSRLPFCNKAAHAMLHKTQPIWGSTHTYITHNKLGMLWKTQWMSFIQCLFHFTDIRDREAPYFVFPT